MSKRKEKRMIPGIDIPSFPDEIGTFFLIIGLIVTWLLSSNINSNSSSTILFYAAWGTLLSLLASILFDLRHGFRNLIRSDLLALTAIYGLCYVEFLFPNEILFSKYDLDNSLESTKKAMGAVSLGIACFSISRHFVNRKTFTDSPKFLYPVDPIIMVRLFWMCFFAGYLHQWLAVKFDFFEWIDSMTLKRWAQPWTRANLGSWKSILYEIGMLQYVISPLGAIILVRAKKYPPFIIILVLLAVALNFFHAFSTGTRHIFFVHLILFATAFCYFKNFNIRVIVMTGITCFCIMWFSTNTMLAFRQLGLKEWWALKSEGYIVQSHEFDTIYVDMTFQNLNRLIERVPKNYDYLGFEVIYNAIVRPIPRALWKGKPSGLSTSIEEVLFKEGESGTWSITYIGEAYFAFGYIGIIVISALFGMGANYWNRFGSPRNSDMGILIFASGFFQFSIAMRSLFSFTTAILPTLLLIFFIGYILKSKVQIISLRKSKNGN